MKKTVELLPGEVALFGYGSLLLQRSVERTLRRTYTKQLSPCHLRGWRRTWDALYPNETFYFERESGERCYPRNIAYLNLRPAKGIVNGVLLVIAEQDLAAFDEREAVYDRVPIAAELTELEVRGGPAYTYLCPPPERPIGSLPVEETAIRASYVRMVEEGLSVLGPEFQRVYAESTDNPPSHLIIDDRLNSP